MSIERIVEISFYEIQTEKAKNMDITTTNCCCVCGKKIKGVSKIKMVHLLTNGNIVSTDQNIENS